MKVSVKVIHQSEEKTAKNGEKYVKVILLIKIEEYEYTDVRYVFKK